MTTAETELKEHEANNKRRLEEKKRSIEERREKVKKLQTTIQDILFDHNNLESNIPVNHGYWDMLNQFKSLNRDDDVEFVRELESKKESGVK